jgi:phosphoribosylanthranilate isomerase
MRVKVCGITSYEDAALALDSGADALGFNFFSRSPRYVDPAAVRQIIRRLPPLTTTVGLFVNIARSDEVATTARRAGVQVLQLHGDESPDYCRALCDWPLIKALRIGGAGIREDLSGYPVQAFLLDVRDDDRFGGTGKTFDWKLAEGLNTVLPVILAGGLKPENVGAAIRSVRPYGVDVCSGVEQSPGRKDAAKLSAFMSEVYNVCRSF